MKYLVISLIVARGVAAGYFLARSLQMMSRSREEAIWRKAMKINGAQSHVLETEWESYRWLSWVFFLSLISTPFLHAFDVKSVALLSVWLLLILILGYTGVILKQRERDRLKYIYKQRQKTLDEINRGDSI